MKQLVLFMSMCLFLQCGNQHSSLEKEKQTGIQLMILGIAQDAGYPQAGCLKDCCQPHLAGTESSRSATSFAIIDFDNNKKWLFEATPDIKKQLYQLHEMTPDQDVLPNGIFLTHAHIGHYTGLMHLGREVMGTNALPVFTMPKMQSFLTSNGPWSQLVRLNNIALQPLQSDSTIQLSDKIEVAPFRVPHRDEFSETVGYEISINNKKVLFIPDIDKWEKWNIAIEEKVKEVDLALLDGTFFNNEELPNRDMSEIPHPFIVESMDRLNDLSTQDKQKVMFIHFNHTNPLLRDTPESTTVQEAGFQLAREGMLLKLES